MILRPEEIVLFLFLIIVYVIPITLGFTSIRKDADRSGQPGIMWAILTIPLGWLAVLVYIAIRAIRAPSPQR
jgi:ethanolamine transporter EutH